MRIHLLPADAPPDVRLWLVDIDLNAPLIHAGANELHDSELARAHRFLRHQDAARFVTMRAALRRLLAAELNVDSADLAFIADTNGRPLLSMPDAPDFNVSHSGAHGLIALSFRRRVGVDIEESLPSLDWHALEASVLHPTDKRIIAAMPQADASSAFFACWTAKEAVLKAHGDGIGGKAIGMDDFSVLPRNDARYAVSAEPGAFQAISLAVPQGYAAALAWSEITQP